MIMGTSNSRKLAVDRDKSLMVGLQKHLVNHPFVIGKQTYALQDVLNVLQARVDTALAVNPVRAAFEAAVKADRDERSKTRAFVRDIRGLVRAMFGDNPDIIADFGLPPRRDSKLTVAELTTAIAKNKATREARGTKGKKELAKIHGTVPEAAPVAAATPKA
jgi:hypothetical protein